MNKKESMTDLELEEFFKFIYGHLQGLPKSQIEQAVILVSNTSEGLSAYRKLTLAEIHKDAE
jgi:hypothetical protein